MTFYFYGQRPSELVVGEVHNIFVVTESLFAAGGRHIYLWPEATRLYKSHVPTKNGTYGHYTDTDLPWTGLFWIRPAYIHIFKRPIFFYQFINSLFLYKTSKHHLFYMIFKYFLHYFSVSLTSNETWKITTRNFII